MCGIVGFVGNHQAAPILLDGLSKLEYRGYDSAGMAVRDGDGAIEVVKAKGRLKILAEDVYKRQAWISEVSKRFRQSQIKAAVKVNDEMLRFYWQLGKELHDRKNKFSYGQSFYKTISYDLRKELPDVKSFSETNLKYMQYFYEMYPEDENRPQLVDDFHNGIIFGIPWGHQRVILDKCKGDPKKALFFVEQVIENGWSRAVLLNFLDTDLYELSLIHI